MFELSNKQREYLGIEPIMNHWDRLILKGNSYTPEGILYFDEDVLTRHIISTDNEYKEIQYQERTNDRKILLPKTNKGKERKLTASTLESCTAIGVYFTVNKYGDLLIGNYNSQTTFYSSSWDAINSNVIKDLPEWVEEFIITSPENHQKEINDFKKLKRKNIKFSSGDFFTFKINRTEYGFGRILLSIDALKKQGLVPKEHGLNLIMAKPVLVKLYAYKSDHKKIDINVLEDINALPSDYIMDNILLYGEYEIIGNKRLTNDELDFPICYSRNLNHSKRSVFFQWGMISKELPLSSYDKYLVADNPFVAEKHPSRKVFNPYGYYSIGFCPKYGAIEIKQAIENNGIYNFDKAPNFGSTFDLRNPKNDQIRSELFKKFGLDPKKDYYANCLLTNTADIIVDRL